MCIAAAASFVFCGCSKDDDKTHIEFVSESSVEGAKDKIELKSDKNNASKSTDTAKTKKKTDSKKSTGSKNVSDTGTSSENKALTKDEELKSQTENTKAQGNNKTVNPVESKESKSSSDKVNKESSKKSTSNTENKTGSTSESKGQTQESHTHKWIEQTRNVHHDAVSSQVWVQDKAVYDEPIYTEQPIYETQEKVWYNGCGTEFDYYEAWREHSISYDEDVDDSHTSFSVVH